MDAMPVYRDDSRRMLERQISDLWRDRLRVEDNIRKLEASQARIFRDEPSKRVTALDDEIDSKRQRSRSRSRSSKRKDADDEGKEGDVKKGDEDREKERKRDRAPKKLDPRSRMIFGKMLGHLHSAKNRLDTEKGSKGRQLLEKAQEKTEEKLSLTKINIKEFRKEKFDQMKKEEQEKCLAIDKAIEEKEMLLLQRRLESHYSLMMNFIRTKAEPTIFYLPAKHTKETEQALEETRAAIKHKISSLKAPDALQPAQEGEEVSGEAVGAKASEAADPATEKEPEEAKASDKASDDEVSDKDKEEEEKDGGEKRKKTSEDDEGEAAKRSKATDEEKEEQADSD